MYIEGLDEMDNKILEVLKDNARATYSEIGEVVGLSRVAVKNRIEILEKNGIIQGYKTVINPTNVPEGISFTIDVEAEPAMYRGVVDALVADKYLHKVYTTTGTCRLHAVGFAPNVTALQSHVNALFLSTKGIRKLYWNLLLTTIKDVEGEKNYERKMSESI